MNRTKIDKKNWERREIFDFFSSVSNPFYMVTFKQDVTNLHNYTKNHGISFYYGLVYLCNKAINDVDAFSYVTERDEIFHLKERLPSFTDLKKGSELFHIVTMDEGEIKGDIKAFCQRAAVKSSNQEEFICYEDEKEDLIYFSCVPWIEMTALTNERDLASPKAKDDAIPHIAWGRYENVDGRKVLHISIEVNHRFIDGIHIGKFYQKLTELIDAL